MSTAREHWNAATWIGKWSAVIISLAAVWGIASTAVNWVMPREEAHQDHDAIVEQLSIQQKTLLEREKNDRIDRHNREIARLERDLQAKELPEREQAFIERELDRLENLKKCIREGSC